MEMSENHQPRQAWGESLCQPAMGGSPGKGLQFTSPKGVLGRTSCIMLRCREK